MSKSGQGRQWMSAGLAGVYISSHLQAPNNENIPPPAPTPRLMKSQSAADKRLSGRFSCHFVKSVVSILIVMCYVGTTRKFHQKTHEIIGLFCINSPIQFFPSNKNDFYIIFQNSNHLAQIWFKTTLADKCVDLIC